MSTHQLTSDCCFFCGDVLARVLLEMNNPPARTSLSCTPCPKCREKWTAEKKVALVEGRRLNKPDRIALAIKCRASRAVIQNLLQAQVPFFDEPTGRYSMVSEDNLVNLPNDQRADILHKRFVFILPKDFQALRDKLLPKSQG